MKAFGKVIVVTGAGNGMGRELTLQLLRKGASVAAVDISEEGLAHTAALAGHPAGLSTHRADITDWTAVLALVAEVIAFHGKVDGLVNNAGIIQPFVGLEDLEMSRITRVMDVNFYGTLHLVKAFLPVLKQRPEAHIVNISSMGGFLPVPGQSVYGASKAAVKMLSEALQAELSDTSVRVTVVIPGGIATDIKKNSYGGARASDEQKDSKMVLTPEKAAARIIDGMERNRARMVIGKDANVMNLLNTLSPSAAMRLMTRVMGAHAH